MKFKIATRAIIIGWSTINALSGTVLSVLFSIEVIRFCSKELWGSMVEIMLWFGLASHFISWGNRNLLLREFSIVPKDISENWTKNLQSRIVLYLLISIVLLFLRIDLQLKFLLFFYLSANFLYKSYDVIITYKKLFVLSVLLETTGFILIYVYIFLFRSSMTINRLVVIVALTEGIKAIVIWLILRKEFKVQVLKAKYAYLVIALPFFLLEFSGLLQSKTDLICVTYFFSKNKIAQYQVFVNFLLLVQSASAFILAPFIKNIYRLKLKSIRKLSLRFFAFGTALAVLSMVVVNFFILLFYHFTVSLSSLVGGSFFIIPIFFYLPYIILLMKQDRQNTIVIVNAIGILLSGLLNIILIPITPDGISGAVFAIAITQWIMLFVYLAIQKHKKVEIAIA